MLYKITLPVPLSKQIRLWFYQSWLSLLRSFYTHQSLITQSVPTHWGSEVWKDQFYITESWLAPHNKYWRRQHYLQSNWKFCKDAFNTYSTLNFNRQGRNQLIGGIIIVTCCCTTSQSKTIVTCCTSKLNTFMKISGECNSPVPPTLVAGLS